MKTTEHLYGPGFSPEILEEQKNIAKYKIKRARALIKELQKVTLMERDDKRIMEVLKAIEFNEKLLQGL